jgi:hypothetical protein
MSTNFDLAEATINFTAGTESTWNAFVLPIPENVVVYTVDTKKFKKGDGNHRYSELPEGPSIEGIASGESNVVNVLELLEIGDDGSIIVIENETYVASDTKLNDLIDRLTAIANTNTVQTANMDAITNQFTLINQNVTGADDGKLAIVTSHQMKPGVLGESLVVAAPVNPVNIKSIGFYSDQKCTIPITDIDYNSVCYCKVNAQHDVADVDDLSYTLTETNDLITSTHIDRGLFEVTVGQINVGGPVTFTATVTYNTDSTSVTKDLTINQYVGIIVATYGGANSDKFSAIAADSSGNLYAVGDTKSEGSGNNDALIVKFNSSLSILARKIYGGSNHDFFSAVAIDSSGNIFVAGYTEGTAQDCIVIKFDSSLNKLAGKRYGGASTEYFYGINVDSSGNVYAVGFTSSEGSGNNDALIIKFDSSLNKLAGKRYGGTGGDYFNGVTIDTSGNVYAVGYTASEGSGSHDALIIKFDSSLNKLAGKRYGGTASDVFYKITIDSSNNIYVVGNTSSEGSGNYDALIIKFDSNLNKLAGKRYGGSGIDYFYDVVIDGSGNIYAVGSTTSESVGDEALIVKFDNNLNILYRKRCGGSSTDIFVGVAINTFGNAYAVGFTGSEGIGGGSDCIIAKFIPNVPSGSSTGTILTAINISDSNLTLANSALTLADSALTLADSALTLANSTLALANSTLTLEKDTFY